MNSLYVAPSNGNSTTYVPTNKPKKRPVHPNPVAVSPLDRSLTAARIETSGWVQINNVYVPFIVKNRQRLVPHQILVACKILEPAELRSVVMRASAVEVLFINVMIRECNTNNEQIPNNALLVNIRHVLVGTRNLVYAKILPKVHPTAKVNRQYKSVLAAHGGSLLIGTRLVPFVCVQNHTYLPLDDILCIYPNLYTQLKSFVRVPRMNELDYLQLVQLYSGGKELSSDALVLDLTNLHQVQIVPSKTITLLEHHAREKSRFEQQIRLLSDMPVNKRKHSDAYDARQLQAKMKLSHQYRTLPPTAFMQPVTGYFPVPAAHHEVNPWLSSPGARMY